MEGLPEARELLPLMSLRPGTIDNAEKWTLDDKLPTDSSGHSL